MTSPIKIVDPKCSLVQIDFEVPQRNVLHWTLNGQPAAVVQKGNQLQVEADLLLAPGQQLTCHVAVHELEEIHQRLQDLWLPRWNKHLHTPPEQWRRIVRFCEAFLPRGVFEMPQWTYEDWIHTVKHFKTRTSAGPDGWARSDLMHAPRKAGEDLVRLYNRIESTSTWPAQWTNALVKCIAKTVDADTANGFRPITLFSINYRAWASHRSRQCLQYLNRFADDLQCGYAEDHEASDIWYHVQTLVELSLLCHDGAHGVVGDLVKAFNLIPREPCWLMMRLLGIPNKLLDCWKTFLHALNRRFVVRDSCGAPLSSVTGFAEGCPLSCTAMCALDVAWHCYQRKFSSLTRPLSFVDNFELISSQPRALLHGLEIMREWCSIMDMQLDEKKLYAWSTTQSGRSTLRGADLKVEYASRDLGGQCNYGARLHNSLLVSRLKAVDVYFQVLRRSSKSPMQKKLCIQVALLPRGLHGCEAVSLGVQHLTHFGAGIMKALHWNRAGATATVRLGILNTEALDPQFFQFYRCLMLFRRQCLRFESIRQRWVTFLLHQHERPTPGPFAKLWEQLQLVDWHIDGQLFLQIGPHVSFSLLHCPLSVLKKVAVQAWANLCAKKMVTRAGYGDLVGVDISSLKYVDSHFSSSQIELLNIVRDGSFFTGSHQHKFDSHVSRNCEVCGEFDSPEHRYISCPRYVGCRQFNAGILAEWEGLPQCTRVHGLLPDNPYRQLAWEALCCLPFEPDGLGCCHCLDPVLNVFLDGTSSHPRNPDITLASWAFIVVGSPPLEKMGHVSGLCQTIARAELSAMLHLLTWAETYCGELHAWSDSKTVIEGFRFIQHNGLVPRDYDHQDLRLALDSKYRSLRCKVRVHKIAAHQQAANLEDPISGWASDWNDSVDKLVQEFNFQRPSWFVQVWDSYVHHWHLHRDLLLKVASLHVAVAEADIRRKQDHSSLLEEAEDPGLDQFMERHCEPLECLVSMALDDLPLDWLWRVSESCEFGFSALKRLQDWAVQIESCATHLILVSYVELCVAFRLLQGQPFSSLCHGLGGNIFLSNTFASELRLFTKAFKTIMAPLDLVTSSESVSLSHLGVDLRLQGVVFPWSYDLMVQTSDAIKIFVGKRRVKSPQSWARPFQS